MGADPNPQPPASGSSSAKMDQVQSQVNEVKVILKDNINKVLERGDRLDDLINKTDDLQASLAICRNVKLEASHFYFYLCYQCFEGDGIFWGLTMTGLMKPSEVSSTPSPP
uniref:Vesicle-associated membrane protein 8-like n=1 Tax=Nothobranchius furzeri TaxID=105023 RepID=A0A8C6LFH7_NOTFU